MVRSFLVIMANAGHNNPIDGIWSRIKGTYDAIRSTLETANLFAILTAFAV
jgi:hypothetical protein